MCTWKFQEKDIIDRSARYFAHFVHFPVGVGKYHASQATRPFSIFSSVYLFEGELFSCCVESSLFILTSYQ